MARSEDRAGAAASGRSQRGQDKGGGEQTARSGDRNKGGGEQTARGGERTRAAASRRHAAGTGEGRRRAVGAQRGQDKGGAQRADGARRERGVGKKVWFFY